MGATGRTDASTSTGPSRRRLLGLAGAGAAGLSGIAVAVGATPASAATTVAGQSLVPVPANPSFVFAADLSNARGAGEASPVTSAYWLGTYEVTNAQYLTFLAATERSAPSYWSEAGYPSGKADHPVLLVSLADATAYCAWLTAQTTGWTFRLPTEAEWENAAAGPQSLTYPWGNSSGTSYTAPTLTCDYNYNAVCAAYYLAEHGPEQATYTDPGSTLYGLSFPISDIVSVGSTGNIAGWNSFATRTGFIYTDVYDELTGTGGYTTPVSTYPGGVSPYGVQDMSGNCWEWTTSLITATNGGEAGRQVNAIRGGSWYANGNSCTAKYRGEGRTGSGYYPTVGLRVAATAT